MSANKFATAGHEWFEKDVGPYYIYMKATHQGWQRCIEKDDEEARSYGKFNRRKFDESTVTVNIILWVIQWLEM